MSEPRTVAGKALLQILAEGISHTLPFSEGVQWSRQLVESYVPVIETEAVRLAEDELVEDFAATFVPNPAENAKRQAALEKALRGLYEAAPLDGSEALTAALHGAEKVLGMRPWEP